jgi:DNA-directed RNA polymerase subunit F
MANEELKTHFKKFLDHVLQRIDSEALYKLLDDIMQYNDSHEEIYQELCRRLPEVMPNALFDLKHILGSLSAIKKDLGGQAYELLKTTRGNPHRRIG